MGSKALHTSENNQVFFQNPEDEFIKCKKKCLKLSLSLYIYIYIYILAYVRACAHTHTHKRVYIYIYIYIYICIYISSLSCAASTDIPDPLSPRLPIIHRLCEVFRVTSLIITYLLYVCSSWLSCF